MNSPKPVVSPLSDALSEFAYYAGLQEGITPASASEVFQIAEDVNRKFQSSSPTTVKFSQKLSPCLQSINRFSSIVDTFVQSDPVISALVWGSLKFLLQGALHFTNYIEKLGDMFAEFGEFFPVVSEYDVIFQSSDTVRVAVSHLYTDLVHFFTRAVKFLKKKPRELIFRTFIKPFEHDYAQILKDYHTHRNELQAAGIVAMEKNASKERKLAEAAREAAGVERRCAQEERIQAQNEREAAEAERKKAGEERAAAQIERKEAVAERQRAERAREVLQKEIQRQEVERKEAFGERVAAQKSRERALQESNSQNSHRKTVNRQLHGLEADSMLRWLNPHDYENTLSQIVRQRHEDTVQWIKERPEYLSWRQYANWRREMLWIYGGPGMGKTILAATIIEDLRGAHAAQSPEPPTKPYAVCFFFFESNNIFEQPEAAMLRALVTQLLHEVKGLESVKQTYLARSSVHATLIELREAFSTLTSMSSGVYVVVDGLDETPNAADTLQLLLGLLIQVSPVMKLLVISRPDPEIRRFFHSQPQFEVTEDITCQDVRRVVTARVEAACEGKKIRGTDPTLRKDIVNALVSSSSGVFLWATMQVKQLQTLRVQTDRTLRAAIRNLPNGVADIYGRILTKINSYAEEDRLLAEELLRWVVCAIRPLNVSEVCCALAIETGEEELNLDNIPANSNEIVDACGPLLSIDSEGGVRLVHSTVARYLLEKPDEDSVPRGTSRYFIKPTQAHTMMAAKCLSYLSLLSFRNRISKSRDLMNISTEEVAGFPLLEYATSNWWKHAVRSDVSRSSAKTLVNLMFKLAKSTQGLTWLEVSITLSRSVEHLLTFSKQLRSWLHRLEFEHEHISELKLWLDEIMNLARVWEPILRESPFELRSTIRKFGTGGRFFHRYFGSDFVGDIGPPPVTLRRSNTDTSAAQENTFDILIDNEEGYFLHPSGKLRFQFRWELEQRNETNTLQYTIYCESPITRRQFKRIHFAHDISWELSDPDKLHIGLHSVAFSPDWDYMALATIESERGLRMDRPDQGNTFIRVFLWRVKDLDSPGDETLFNLPWISSTTGNDGRTCEGYVGQCHCDSFRGSRCAVAFRSVESMIILQAPFGALDVRTGTSFENPQYLRSILSQKSVSQCTFSPDGRRIAMVRDNSAFEIANMDGSNVCETKFPGGVCEIVAISRTGRYVAIYLAQSITALPSSQQSQSRILVLDTVTNTQQVLLTGFRERRFDEVSFNLRGWLSWLQWAGQGRPYKHSPGGLAPIRPDRHCIQLYSVFNWLVGGSSSELFIEPDIDYLLDPQEQLWSLSQPTTLKRELPLSSSATYLFSDRTIRLQNGSFVLSFGFSPYDEHAQILTSTQAVLLPSSLQPTLRPQRSSISVNTAGRDATKPTYRTYTRLFDNNKKLGCLQLAYQGMAGHWMDYVDYKTHRIPESISARVYIWDLCGTPTLVRDRMLPLDPMEITKLRYSLYRRLDVAFHPACDRMAVFNVVYRLDSISSARVEYQLFQERTRYHPDIRAGRTNNSWHVSFSPDGKFVAFAVTATTRSPGLFGSRGEITNAVVLFEIDKPGTPLCSKVSSHGGDTLAMGSCSVVFHPTERKLIWTSLFVFTDSTTKTTTKLLDFDQVPFEVSLVTDLKYDDLKFVSSGNQIYGHPPQNGKPGFWDRLDMDAPQPTNLMEMNTIQFTGLDLSSRQVVGVIPKDDGSNGVIFFRKTIMPLPPVGRLPQNTLRVLRRVRDGITHDFLVVLLFKDGHVSAKGNGENVFRPMLVSVDARELETRPVSPLKSSDLKEVHPLFVQRIGHSRLQEVEGQNPRSASEGASDPLKNRTVVTRPTGVVATEGTASGTTASNGESNPGHSTVSGLQDESSPCAVCGQPGRRCTRCRIVSYCGVEHQRQDWKKHKQSCQTR